MKRIITVLLTLITCMSLFACANANNSAGNGNGNGDFIPTATENPIVLVNGYEENDDLNMLSVFDTLGTVTRETQNADFIKSGNGSLKVVKLKDRFGGTGVQTITPRIYQALQNAKYGYDYGDFSKTVAVELDVYNAEEEVQSIGLRLVYTHTYNNTNKVGAIEWYNLAPKAWTTVRLEVNRESIPVSDGGSVNRTKPHKGLRYVEGLDIMFRPLDTVDRTVYLDDLRLYRLVSGISSESEAKEPVADVLVSLDTQEDINAFRVNADSGFAPVFAPSKAFTTDKNASIKVTVPATVPNTRHFIYLQMQKGSFFPHIDFTTYKDDDRICFDVYSPTERDGIKGYNGGIGFWLSSTGGMFTQKAVKLERGNITHASYTVAELRENSYNNPNIVTYDKSSFRCFEYTNLIQFSLEAQQEETVFYIDNIRMERV